MLLADHQAKAMEGEPGVLKVGRQDPVVKSENNGQSKPSDGDKVCFRCGGSWPHPKRKRSCSAYGLDCKCDTKNHFARVRKNKKKVRTIVESTDSDTDDSYRDLSVKNSKKCCSSQSSDLHHDINGARVFSKLDLANGFHQLELHEDSRGITTFSTHAGPRRFRRLNFGTNSAPEIFHEELRKLLVGIKGVRNIHDDILVTGVDTQDHYRALSWTFRRLREAASLTLKRSDGIRPDPEKAIQSLSAPRNLSQLRSFLGMTNYSAQFICHGQCHSFVDPLRSLTKKDARWVWTEEHQECFEQLKESLKENALLNYYDPRLPTEVVSDASPVGVSAILAQYKSGETVPRVTAYNSRTLTPVERRYGPDHRENLYLKNQLYL
ncbi:Hypothetical predicted protein [Paramuricea clavata]|uniref:Uncharacterized protein n=1 Tax=Paramuricea clavata TaxID=317549 RepID=A0A6S7HXV8_PARCT|nr:Hypothetical predicted protein [Paramuricea clavata]